MAGLDGRSRIVRSFSWRLKDAKWVTKAAVEHARATMPPWRFQMEYEGEWAGAADALFPPDLLQRASADLELPGLAALRGPARILGGVDWGQTSDRTAVVCVARLPLLDRIAEPVFVCWAARHFPVGHDVFACVDEIVAADARWAVLSSEMNGLGGPLTAMLRSRVAERREHESAAWYAGGEMREPVPPVGKFNAATTTWERKADGLGQLKVLADRGQLIFARGGEAGGDFMKQLASARVEFRAHSVGIEATAGGHDDLVDAAYLATGCFPRDRRNVLGHLAMCGDLPQADLPASVAEEPTEEAGSLRIPKRPWLQSVNGLDLTPAPPPGRGWEDGSGPTENPAISRARRAIQATLSRTHQTNERTTHA